MMFPKQWYDTWLLNIRVHSTIFQFLMNSVLPELVMEVVEYPKLDQEEVASNLHLQTPDTNQYTFSTASVP